MLPMTGAICLAFFTYHERVLLTVHGMVRKDPQVSMLSCMGIVGRRYSRGTRQTGETAERIARGVIEVLAKANLGLSQGLYLLMNVTPTASTFDLLTFGVTCHSKSSKASCKPGLASNLYSLNTMSMTAVNST